eukprot:9017434-Pyramimonas_sp.AAC.1
MATRGVLTVKRSMACDTSLVFGLLRGILRGHSRPFRGMFGPLGVALAPRFTAAALGQGSVYLQFPRGRPGPGKC